MRVLVVNADQAFRGSAAETLARRGFAVELAEEAEEGFEKVRTWRPGLILYDVNVPGYDGFEALSIISKSPSGKEAVLVATAVGASADVSEKALAAGAWHFLGGTADGAAVLETAAAVKRHLNRPKDLPRKPAHPAVHITVGKCTRAACCSPLAVFTLKENGGIAAQKDQFETPIYARFSPGKEALDYNLISIAVCPSCYYAFDAAACPRGFPEAAATRPALLEIASSADDTLFLDTRTPAAALVAYRLALANELALGPQGGPESAGRLADLLFKAGAVAHRAGDDRLRDRFFADAEKYCSAAVKMEPCALVYRAAYRIVALYVFFARDADAARAMKLFSKFEKPSAGRMRPRDSRILENYRAAAANLYANRHFHRRANYLLK